jgi:hypothetical protein
MARSKAENRRRRELLTRLAAALSPPSASAYRIRAGLRLTWRLGPYLNVHADGWPRLRVYCAGRAGRYVLLTGNGQVILLDEGIAAAAAAVEAACSRRESGQPAAGPAAAAVQPGP